MPPGCSPPPKKLGIHTAIETNGYYGDHLSDEELALIDLVILDMKAFTLEQHRKVTGGIGTTRRCSNSAGGWPRSSGRCGFAMSSSPGLTDDPDEIAQVAGFAASLGVVERAEILPFHQMGKYKWERLGLDYTLSDTETPSGEAVARAIAIFRDAGLNAN